MNKVIIAFGECWKAPPTCDWSRIDSWRYWISYSKCSLPFSSLFCLPLPSTFCTCHAGYVSLAYLSLMDFWTDQVEFSSQAFTVSCGQRRPSYCHWSAQGTNLGLGRQYELNWFNCTWWFSNSVMLGYGQPRSQGAFPWLWRWGEKKPGKSALGTRLESSNGSL